MKNIYQFEDCNISFNENIEVWIILFSKLLQNQTLTASAN